MGYILNPDCGHLKPGNWLTAENGEPVSYYRSVHVFCKGEFIRSIKSLSYQSLGVGSL